MNEERVLDDVAARLRSLTPVEADRHKIELAYADGTLTLSGEVEDMRAKRLACRAAADSPRIDRVIDRLTIHRAATMKDGEIRDRVRGSLLAEPAFVEIGFSELARSEWRRLRHPLGERGDLRVAVEDGTVVLSGTMPSLSHRRLAVALAWWVPGTRNVVDEIGVVPPEEDNDGELADALLMLLEKDPGVDPASLSIHVEDGVVTLRGRVSRRASRDAAERDAWYVEGVRDVVNEIVVGVREEAPPLAAARARAG